MDTDAAEKFKRQAKIDGIEHASFRITKAMYHNHSPSQETALQFVLEELEAASQGNQKSKNFVNNSGFLPSEYTGASKRENWLGDESELETIQNFVRTFASWLLPDTDLTSEFLTASVDHTMKNWFFGNYARDRFTKFGWSDDSIEKFMSVLNIYKDDEFRLAARLAQIHGGGNPMGSPELILKIQGINEIITHISNKEGEEASKVVRLVQVAFKQIHGKEVYES